MDYGLIGNGCRVDISVYRVFLLIFFVSKGEYRYILVTGFDLGLVL